MVYALKIKTLPIRDSRNVIFDDWYVICPSEFIIIFYIKKMGAKKNLSDEPFKRGVSARLEVAFKLKKSTSK
ncbi:MAG: hypothetical protein DHS20C18_44620 [Saprospiraceae bacterium]|nr:MAG: hypothetical protein DHS20C18_44620 [Saprospiraceae bacterium]